MFSGRELSLVLILVGSAFVLESLRYGFGTLAFPEPGLVPFMMGVVFLAFEFVDLGISLFRPKPASPLPSPRRFAKLKKAIAAPQTHFILLTFGGLSLTYLVGLAAAIGVYAALSARLLGLKSWWKNIAFALSLGVLVHYLFEVIFEIDLPSGWLMVFFGG